MIIIYYLFIYLFIFLYIFLVLGLASSTTASSNVSMVCHQRALSLPSASPMLNTINYQNTNLNIINNNAHHNAQSSSIGNTYSPMTTGKSFAIQPIHQRTRSLPLTEENAIKLSQSPPQSFNLVPSTSQKLNNNSMESIIEDYQSSDTCNNNQHVNSGASSTSILKHLTSPSQLRKKRHHHNVITAPLRSTYLLIKKIIISTFL